MSKEADELRELIAKESWNTGDMFRIRDLAAALLKEQLGVLPLDIAPIAWVEVTDDRITKADMYAPGLPDGFHDLFPVAVADERLLKIHYRAEQLSHNCHMPWDQAMDLALSEAAP